MSIPSDDLARVVAFAIWADEQLARGEWAAAEQIYQRLELPWAEGQQAIEAELDRLMGSGAPTAQRIETELGDLHVSDGFDRRSLLLDIAGLTTADGSIRAREIDVVHALAAALGARPAEATLALLLSAKETGAQVEL